MDKRKVHKKVNNPWINDTGSLSHSGVVSHTA